MDHSQPRNIYWWFSINKLSSKGNGVKVDLKWPLLQELHHVVWALRGDQDKHIPSQRIRQASVY